MEHRPSCLLCCRSLHSPLIPATEPEHSTELAETFDTFCEYMKLDPDNSIHAEYRGKLFPFCASCSFQVYKLVEIHQEKLRILQTLSQMVASITALVLESKTEDQKYLKSESVAAEDLILIEQIDTLRKKVKENYCPRVALKFIPPAELSRLTNRMDSDHRNKRKRSVRALSPDICQEFRTRISSDTENFVVGDSLDVDYDVAVDDTDNNSDHTADEDEEPEVSPPKRRRRTTKARSKKRGKNPFITTQGKRLPIHHKQTGENTYSIQNHSYKFEDGLFKCGVCPHTNKRQLKMNRHILEAHVFVIPIIPEKSLEDLKIGKNKYVIASKYVFEKDTKKNLFRCSTCGYTSILWSGIYNHVFKTHHRKDRGCKISEGTSICRPPGEIKKVGENDYVYLGIQYSLLPHGTHKCCLCGSVRPNYMSMRAHIQEHVDFLPEVPDKSPETYEIVTDLFCLSRKFIFERTGNNFTCARDECFEVRDTFKEMYDHVWREHWSKDTKAKSIGKKPFQVGLVGSDIKGEVEQKKVTDQDAVLATDSNADDISSLEPTSITDSTEASVLPASSNTGEIIACKEDVPCGPTGEMDDKRRKGGRTRLKVPVLKNADDTCLKEILELDRIPLPDFEISPGLYSFKGLEFRYTDRVFYCESCPYTAGARRALFTHIHKKHIQDSKGFVEVSPNEFLYLDQYPGTKEPDGRFRCRVDGCEFVTSFSVLGHLKTHMLKSHCESPPTAPSVEDSEATLQAKLELLKLKLAKHQVGPGLYRYRDFDFHVNESDGQFQCSTCLYRCCPETFRIFAHICNKHVDPSLKKKVTNEKLRIVEVGPNEVLVGGEFPAFKLPNGKYKCGVGNCKSVISRKQGLSSHVRLVHIETSVVCEMCGRIYSNREGLRVHMANAHAEAEEQKCPTCHKSFFTTRSFEIHVKQSHKDKTFICEQCGKGYCTAKTLKDHISFIHTEVRETLPCPECGKVYYTKGSLSVHRKYAHAPAGPKMYPCPICLKEFKYKETIRRHTLVMHEGRKSSEVYKRSQRSRKSTSGQARTPTNVPALPIPHDQTTDESDDEETEEEQLALRHFLNF